jgi:putative ABC transport system permease protein
MRLPLVRGRDFTEDDDRSRPGVVIVNQSLADRHWAGQDPIGRRLTLNNPRGDAITWLSVVGVAKNAVRSRWSAEPDPEIYLPVLQTRSYLERPEPHYSYLTLVIRTSGDPRGLAPAARAVVQGLAPDAAVSDLLTMDEVVAQGMAEPRLYVVLLGSFAAVALVLAAVGIYGVVSYGVTRRHQEIAIRMALGARPADVVRLVVGQGMRTVALGAAAGLAGALALARTLSTLLYGIEPTDPLTLAGVAAALGMVALIATYVPARRAVAIRALGALRHE